MRQSLTLMAILALLAGCSTVSRFTIADRLHELGLDRARAECMADELDNRLDDRDLGEFAQFTRELTREDNTAAVLDSLTNISNPRIARAVATSSLACIIA